MIPRRRQGRKRHQACAAVFPVTDDLVADRPGVGTCLLQVLVMSLLAEEVSEQEQVPGLHMGM